jgi:hypothetical protein
VNAEEESAPWEGLADTADPAGRVDTPRSGKKAVRSSAVRRTAPESGKQKVPEKSRVWLVIAVVAAILIIGAVVVAGLVLAGVFGPKDTGERPPLIVSRAKGFPSVNSALKNARPGDRILIAEEEVKEFLTLRDGKLGWDVTIEPEEGRKVTWYLPDNAKAEDHFVWLTSVQRLRLRKINFDGRFKADEIVLMSGKCPGLTLDECTFQQFKKSAILVNNCEGDSAQPVTLRGLEILSSTNQQAEAALVFDVNPAVFPKINQYIVLRDCRFIGPYTKGPIQKRGPSILDVQGENMAFPNGVNGERVPVKIP